jgi:superfamily II DNA or RNA helicase
MAVVTPTTRVSPPVHTGIAHKRPGIGQIGGGKTDRTGCVDVAVIQSLYRKDEVKDFVAEYCQVIVDECHHISAFTFEQVMKQVRTAHAVVLAALFRSTKRTSAPTVSKFSGTKSSSEISMS